MSFFSFAQNFGLCKIISVNMIGWTEPSEWQLKRCDFRITMIMKLNFSMPPNFRLTKRLNKIYKP